MQELIWLGRDAPHLDRPAIARCGPVVLGCYGGCLAAGATKNEDGALVWCAPDGSWEFAAILDAHASAESAALVLETIAARREAIATLLARPAASALPALGRYVTALFSSPAFRAACREVRGETACLLCARHERFVWWLSIGDCVAYLFHPKLARLGQFALNQRQFFEWVGQVNSFDLPVPCHTTGVRELRGGRNAILLTTDGLLECGSRPFETPGSLYQACSGLLEASDDPAISVEGLLQRVHRERGRDSATIVAWVCDNPFPAARPTL